MAIIGIEEQEFVEKLYTVVSPSEPISSIEHLIGREKELERVRKALLVPGKNVFIHGERGIGKSSLASSSATLYQSADKTYLDVSCSTDTTVKSLVTTIAMQAMDNYGSENRTQKNTTQINLRFLRFTSETTLTRSSIEAQLHTLSDAIELMREVAAIHSDKPICVVDEVDKITDKEELGQLSDFIKAIGDKKVRIKFIFTAVGTTLESILGANASTIRQLETIHLPKLSWDARWDIAINALSTFGISIGDNIYIRLAAVSDGFPSYVHLITDKLLWILFEKDEIVTAVQWEDYYHAIDAAIEGIEADLARPYMKAIEHRSPDYEEVLWSTSVVEWQGAYLQDMYAEYKNVISQRENSNKLSYEQFGNRIRKLKEEEYGRILEAGRKQGHYVYREKLLRGFVRMQAEANGVEIVNAQAESEISKLVRIASKRTGYHHAKQPEGWKSYKSPLATVLSSVSNGPFRRDKNKKQ